ncbi:MAG: universal stress protein [Actinobacteria bacterium]|nr:universal stress protein [Actinomycetota bacterium]NIU65201.1 universal stress protein [Actinomycetota bacterium]NIW27015.1 universal stress protein [Actinomycetota bacterium]NIX19555.1 universal stress protein [Actinomycetota bacterium]
MTEHVLVPHDGSPQAADALEHALREYPDADLTVLHVIDPTDTGYSAGAMFPDFSEQWYEAAKDRAAEIFEHATEVAADHGGEVRTARELGRPSRQIVEYADEHGVDHVVIGSHGRTGVSRILLGSVAETVARRSPVPVTVVR